VPSKVRTLIRFNPVAKRDLETFYFNVFERIELHQHKYLMYYEKALLKIIAWLAPF